MSELRIEKEALSTTLLLSDGTRLPGTLFLAAQSPYHTGAQTVGELMEESERTLPYRDSEGHFLLVGKSGVATVLAVIETTDDDLLEKIPVALRLTGGHRLIGAYLAEKGAGKRLSDALNADEPWFRLECPDVLAWVAKDHLLTVEPG